MPAVQLPTMRRFLAASAALTLSLLAAGSAPAAAGEILATDVSVADAVKRSCIDGALTGGKGYATRSTTAPAAGWVTARLAARSGDWDLALFNSATGERAGAQRASAPERSRRASWPPGTGSRCRPAGARAGRAGRTSRSTSQAVPDAKPQKLSLVSVATPTRARKDELSGLGLDLTEHGGKGFVEVVLHGADDAQTLREAKFLFTTEVADLAARIAARPDGGAPCHGIGQRESLGAAQRPHRYLSPPRRLQRRDEGAGREEPGHRQAVHPAVQDLPGPHGQRDRDHRERQGRTTASRCSCKWAPTTPASGPRASTRWNGRTSWSTATGPRTPA